VWGCSAATCFADAHGQSPSSRRRRPPHLDVVVDCVEQRRHRQQLVVASVGNEGAHGAVHRPPRPPRALWRREEGQWRGGQLRGGQARRLPHRAPRREGLPLPPRQQRAPARAAAAALAAARGPAHQRQQHRQRKHRLGDLGQEVDADGVEGEAAFLVFGEVYQHRLQACGQGGGSSTAVRGLWARGAGMPIALQAALLQSPRSQAARRKGGSTARAPAACGARARAPSSMQSDATSAILKALALRATSCLRGSS
jgi:hypothetical protein